MFKSRKQLRAFRRSIGLILLFFLAGASIYVYVSDNYNGRFQDFFLDRGVSRGLLCAAMPVIAWVDQEEGFLPGPITSFFLKLWAPVQLNIRDPVSVLRLTIPSLANIGPPPEDKFPMLVASSALPQNPPEVSWGGGLTGEALVIIYHTHTGETYALTDGRDRLDGKCGGVVRAGAAVQEVIESKYGFKVVHERKIHDAVYDISYQESEKTLRGLLSRHQNAKVVLDIHRDAGRPRKNSLVKINGREVAPVLLVVGSDARLPFPAWEKNYRFAEQLAGRLNEKFPGLCLGVRVKDGRYNQFLHPRAILVEIGSASNSTEEAVASAGLFADVLGEMVMEMIKTGGQK